MKKKFIFISVVFYLCTVSSAYATTLTLPAIAANPEPDYSSCSYTSSGTVIGGSSSSGCSLNFPIPIPSGSTLNSVTIYYYDNYDYLFMAGSLVRETLSTGTSSTLDKDSDGTISSSVKSMVLNYGGVTSSSYAYRAVVWVASGTEVMGISISY